MSRTSLLFSAIFLSSISLHAQPRLIMGAGAAMGCGDWVATRPYATRKPGALVERNRLYQMYAWIDGFLSGENMGSSKPDFLAKVRPTPENMYTWIDNYCQAHPLENLATAADLLVVDLLEKAKTPGE